MSVTVIFRWGSVSMDVTRVTDDAADLTITCDCCGQLGMIRVGKDAHPLEGGHARAGHLARGHICWRTDHALTAAPWSAAPREPE